MPPLRWQPYVYIQFRHRNARGKLQLVQLPRRRRDRHRLQLPVCGASMLMNFPATTSAQK
jgi:hypothetical protein